MATAMHGMPYFLQKYSFYFREHRIYAYNTVHRIYTVSVWCNYVWHLTPRGIS